MVKSEVRGEMRRAECGLMDKGRENLEEAEILDGPRAAEVAPI